MFSIPLLPKRPIQVQQTSKCNTKEEGSTDAENKPGVTTRVREAGRGKTGIEVYEEVSTTMCKISSKDMLYNTGTEPAFSNNYKQMRSCMDVRIGL